MSQPFKVLHDPLVPGAGASDNWHYGLCDCFKLPCFECTYGLCCPRCAMASARTEMDNSDWCLNVCCLTPPMAYNVLRTGYSIPGSGCGDACLSLCCMQCAACQMLGEAHARGKSAKVSANENRQYWTSGLFGCFDNCGSCIFACLCPVCAMAQARSQFDGSNQLFNCCFLTLPIGRNMIREGYGIEGSCCGDVCASFCCPVCTITQMLAEVDARRRIV